MARLTYRTAGESHGSCLLGILEGMPAGLALDVARIDAELVRRQGGYGRGGRMKIERDHVEIVGGLKGGVTIGAPVAFRIPNKDDTIERLPMPDAPRPGHADLAGCQKFGHRDARAVLERSSARETAARVAAAGIARQVLEFFEIEVFAHVVELADVSARGDAFVGAGDAKERADRRAASDFYCLDPDVEESMRAAVDAARAGQDSLGGVFEVQALGLPPGLGGYASADQRLTARLGQALFSIPAMKGVEFGLGFESARRPGSAVHDPIVPATDPAASPWGARWGKFSRTSNRAGGLEGGMTTGQPLCVRVAMKPIPTLRRGIASVDFTSGEARPATYQRSDVTSVPAASVVGEAMVALTLTNALLEKLGGDSMAQVEAAWRYYGEQLRAL